MFWAIKYKKRQSINMEEKTVSATNSEQVKEQVSDVQFFGNPDLFKCLAKASSESQGWMKSTKAMEVNGGCVVQVTTQQRNDDGSYSLAEAITFVPSVKIKASSVTPGHFYLGL